LQQKENHGVLDGPPKTLSSRFQALSCLQPTEPLRTRWKARPEEAAGARGPRGGRKTAFSSPKPAEQAVQNRSIGTLAGRAQARYRLAGVQCTKSASRRDLFETFEPDERDFRGSLDRPSLIRKSMKSCNFAMNSVPPITLNDMIRI
jgi:hypothetical protein